MRRMKITKIDAIFFIACFLLIAVVCFFLCNGGGKKYICNFEGLNPSIPTWRILDDRICELGADDLAELFGWLAAFPKKEIKLMKVDAASGKPDLKTAKRLSEDQKKIISSYIAGARVGTVWFYGHTQILEPEKLPSFVLKEENCDSDFDTTNLRFYKIQGRAWVDISCDMPNNGNEGFADDFYAYMKGFL